MVGSDLIEVIEVALSEVLHLVDPVVLLATVLSGNGDPTLASLVVIADAESIFVLCFRFSCFTNCRTGFRRYPLGEQNWLLTSTLRLM